MTELDRNPFAETIMKMIVTSPTKRITLDRVQDEVLNPNREISSSHSDGKKSNTAHVTKIKENIISIADLKLGNKYKKG